LQEEILESGGQMPTVYPLQIFALEFTGKNPRHEALAIPLPIGVYRLGRASLS
jgi:hypothetical protein